MTLERGRELETKADAKRIEGEYADAGDLYSLAAFEAYGDSVPSEYGTTLSFGQEFLLESTLSYALAGMQDRRQNRASIGVLISEDVIDREPLQGDRSAYDRSRRGVWYEYIGDFHVVGGLGSPEQWYDRAQEVYENNGDPRVSLAEQEHLNLFTFYRVVRRGISGNGDIQEFPDDITFSEWVSKKRSELPTIIAEMTENGAQWEEIK